jgi:diaminopimelate epimerase
MSDGVDIVKMSGAGNDFIVIGREQASSLGTAFDAWVVGVCRRGLSVGADGVVLVTARGDGVADVRFFNPDGSEAFCGNATRCAARYVAMRSRCGVELTLHTAIGSVPARLRGERVALELPVPVDRGELAWTVAGERHVVHWIDAGVPHALIAVEDVDAAPLSSWGPALRRHPVFGPGGTNVDLVALAPGGVRVRTWERGVEGETLSCGSGAMAAGLWARLHGAGERIRVGTASGIDLEVCLVGPPAQPSGATLEGDARIIFEGVVTAEATTGF